VVGGGGASLPDSLPPVRVEGARLIFGEHGVDPGGAPWFSPLQEIALTGALEPSPGESGVYELGLVEDAPAGRSPAELRGDLDLRRGSGRLALRDVDFGTLRVEDATPAVETLLRRLRIDGRLPEAALRFERDGSFQVTADLAGVDVLAPAPVLNPEAAGAGDQRLRLSEVSGELRLDPEGLHANLEGYFEDLDARVLIDTTGYGAGADLTVQMIIGEYRLGPTPGLLPFAPELAAEFVQRFSGPEALISGRVTVSRSGGEATANGLFSWSEGRVAFQGFPYPIEDISGRLLFDDEGVYVTDLRGRGPTGASITAEVVAIPPGDDAEIGAKIQATSVPVDEHLLGAIGGAKADALRSLFDASSLPAATAERLARSGAEFRAGGAVDLEIDVEKRGGEFGEWAWDVRAESPELGLAAEALAYPLIAEGFVLTLDRASATAEISSLAGPTGARGSARVGVPLGGEPGDEFRPAVSFEIERAPIDELLFEAIAPRSERLADALRALRASGVLTGEGEARLGGAIDADSQIRFSGVGLRSPESGRAVASGLEGLIETQGGRGTFAARGSGPDGAAIGFNGEFDLESGVWSGEFRAKALRLAPELSEVVGVFSAPAGERFERVVAERRIEGVVDARLRLEATPDGAIDWALDVDGGDAFALEIGGAFIELRALAGRVSIDSGSDVLRFQDTRATLLDEGRTVGEVQVSGELDPEGRARLSIAGESIQLESRVVRAFAAGSDDVASFLAEADPSGLADLVMTYTVDPGGEPVIEGRLTPRGVELSRNGERLSLVGEGGAVTFGPSGVGVEGLRLEGEGWGVLLDGMMRDSGFEGEIDLSSQGQSRGLLAALPASVREVAEAIGLEVSEDGELWATGGLGGERSEIVLGFLGASCHIGAPIDRADGALTLTRETDDGPLVGSLRLDRFEAATVPMSEGRAALRWDAGSGVLTVPAFSASCAGGVIHGRARATTGAPAGGLGAGREFFVDARCSGVPLVWIINRPELDEPRSTDELPGTRARLSDRGLIAGRLTVRGGVGASGPPRVGRGEFRITGGEVVRLPLLTPVYELVNLQPPVGEELRDAAIEFGLTGDRLVFDRLFVRSDSIVVEAAGDADLSDRSLNLAVRTRGRVRIPFISDLLNALRDELVGVRITGSIGDPRYEVVQLPMTGRVLLGAIAPGAGGSAPPTPPPPRPEMTEHVLSTLEPIDE